MPHRITNQQKYSRSAAPEDGEGIREFFERELPPASAKETSYLTNAVLEAGRRYDRFNEKRLEWLDYARRLQRLMTIRRTSKELASELAALDDISRDDLASRTDPKEIAALIGALHFLTREVTDLVNQAQQSGRPRDLAEERWIAELADIYENAFGRPARVWGSGGDNVKRRGKFYRLLELSRPKSFPRYGKLSPRQVTRTLRRRKKYTPKQAVILGPLEVDGGAVSLVPAD